MADTSSASTGITRAADRIRETAKWLTVSLATLGGVLIAGSQLSNIGALRPFSSRFMVAVVGGGIAAIATVAILGFAIWVATTPAVSLRQLATEPPAGLREILTDPRYLDGMQSVVELDSAYVKALWARNAAFERRTVQDDEQHRVEAEKADADLVSLSGAVQSLLEVVSYMRLAYRWRRAGAALLACGVLAAAGIGAFAWAAHPPESVRASTAVPSLLATPVKVSVVLTVEGRQALGKALGPKCPVSSSLMAFDLGQTSAGPDVVIQQEDCRLVRFVAVPSWASIQK